MERSPQLKEIPESAVGYSRRLALPYPATVVAGDGGDENGVRHLGEYAREADRR
jgi:hypothetical protein